MWRDSNDADSDCGFFLLAVQFKIVTFTARSATVLHLHYSRYRLTHSMLQLDGCIVWNAHNTVLGSKRLAICATVYVGTNRKHIYDFLLMINTNLPPILHHFGDACRSQSLRPLN